MNVALPAIQDDLGGGLALGLTLRYKIKNKPRIFSATAMELGKDYTALQPRTP